jgi:hypothetical protein
MRGWVLVLLCVAGCHKEPTIVIRFEPKDMTGAAPGPGEHAQAGAAAKPPSTPEAAGDACANDRDCTTEPVESCCDCKSGGQLRAVSVARHAARPKATCKDVVCAQVMSVDPSCAKVAACVAGRCALVENEARPATP